MKFQHLRFFLPRKELCTLEPCKKTKVDGDVGGTMEQSPEDVKKEPWKRTGGSQGGVPRVPCCRLKVKNTADGQ